MSTTRDSVQQIFNTTIHDFRAGLRDDELYNDLLRITTIDEVYDATDKLQQEQAKTGKLRHLSKIEPYLEGLRNYASVIEVFMQAKPEVIALIWGPIKFLLQWAGALKQSLDAIIELIADIGVRLPEFQKAVDLFGHNTHIKEVLALFFKDILDFYLIALRFFRLPHWKMIFGSLWPQRKEAIKVVMCHVDRHTMLLRNEVRLEHIQAEHDARAQALAHYEKTMKSLQRQEYQSLKTDLSPRTYDTRMNWLNTRRCSGTGQWLIRDPLFARWVDTNDDSASILWLQGIPGSGKTFLSSTVVNHIKAPGRTLYAFLSYIFSDSVSALSIIHSLIFQLASSGDDLQSMLCQSSREALKSSSEAAREVLILLLSHAGPVHIIVDGLDEIEKIERTLFLREVLLVMKSCKETKLLISCRPEADITKMLTDQAKVIRVDERNSGSIQTYITQHTQQWFRERQFLPDAQAEITCLLEPLASKSKGMFLYAKIVLSSIEYLEPSELHDNIQVLPETLDAAYARILIRINSAHSPALREKARKILGWVGLSSRPLTIHEMEQALIINPENLAITARVTSQLDLVHICGPIVEVVDEYVQFVHFTAREYFFSPKIPKSIDIPDATLSLAKVCIAYLSQKHHDPRMTRDTLEQNILSGMYRLHNYAATMWLELVEQIGLLFQSKAIPDELVSLLHVFSIERHNPQYHVDNEQVSMRGLESVQSSWPLLYAMLCNAIRFRQDCATSAYKVTSALDWTDRDPLSVSQSAVRISERLEALLAKSRTSIGTNLDIIRSHYGNRLFKCSFLSCAERKHGFETQQLRDSHIRQHDRPWKCDFKGCEFEHGGFLSRRMRDDHLDNFHKASTNFKFPNAGTLDPKELQPLLFDLVRADNVEAVKAIRDQYRGNSFWNMYNHDCRHFIARFGSPDMFDLLLPSDRVQAEDLSAAAYNKNVELVRHLFCQFDEYTSNIKTFDDEPDDWYTYQMLDTASAAVMESDCEEIFKTWLQRVAVLSRLSSSSKRLTFFSHDRLISATRGRVDREHLLIALWEKCLPGQLDRSSLGAALLNVASTTCSVELATWLIRQGAPVDYRRNSSYLTPLHHAARKSSSAAANLIAYLLSKGANPNANSARASLPICEEKGAKKLENWLGSSWDELVAQAKAERESMQKQKVLKKKKVQEKKPKESKNKSNQEVVIID